MEKTNHNRIYCSPFLRWAGGKSWLIKCCRDFSQTLQFSSYHEPFLGGGSFYFFLQPKHSFLSDSNGDLIQTYIQLRDNVEDVISELSKFQNSEEGYYAIRKAVFKNVAKKAARFIFLNQTSFNGIYRVNRAGNYNVPYGFRQKDFCKTDKLRAASIALKNAVLTHCDFKESLKNICVNDLVFLDPPYTVTHNLNGFIKYNSRLFDMDSQHALSSYIDAIKEKGAYYLLTNADHEQVRKIFKKKGDQMIEMNRSSLVGGSHARRGSFTELLFTNIDKNLILDANLYP